MAYSPCLAYATVMCDIGKNNVFKPREEMFLLYVFCKGKKRVALVSKDKETRNQELNDSKSMIFFEIPCIKNVTILVFSQRND